VLESQPLGDDSPKRKNWVCEMMVSLVVSIKKKLKFGASSISIRG